MSELAHPYLLRSARRVSNEIRPWEIATLRPEPEFRAEPDTAARSQQALCEAEALIQDAKQAVAELRESAQNALEQEARQTLEQARAQGLAEGRANAEADRLALLEPLQALLAELPHAWEQFCLRETPVMIEICIEAAERVLHEQLTLEPERIATIVRAAIAHVPQAQNLTVTVHPEDLLLLQECALTESTTNQIQLTADLTMRRGGCRVESRQGVVDASHDGALLRLADTLRGI